MKTLKSKKLAAVSMKEKKIHKIDDWPKFNCFLVHINEEI